MPTLIMMAGLPRSGKSTRAKELGYPIVNRDAIRLALHGRAYIQKAEPWITLLEKLMVEALFKAGHDKVVLDATNLDPNRRARWSALCDDIVLEVLNTSPEECIRRAVEGGREDLVFVINRMAERYGIKD